MKSYPVGQGNHNNLHFILRSANTVFKLCCFPNTEKIYIMSSSCKTVIDDIEVLLCNMRTELYNKWGYNLIADSSNLLNLRFDNTKHLISSDYYINS